jgi:hypothetical protein
VRHYESYISDNSRWERFELRPGDIIVTTPPKCGTTWMQMCCLILVHGPALPGRLSELAPWLDQILDPIEEVGARLAAQQHRRVIKSHTPIDGLPWRSDVVYIGVGRDPRDAALSSSDHFRNMRLDVINAARERAGLPVAEARADRPTDAAGAFRYWVDSDPPVEEVSSSIKFTVHHLATVWARRDEPNVGLFHYSDLRRDLAAEMRRLARLLDIEVDEGDWPALVDAATFESMRRRADELTPNADHGLFRDNERFFAEGRLGGWRNVIDAEDLARYDARIAELTDDADFVAWLHR